jgi:hypothetical protein
MELKTKIKGFDNFNVSFLKIFGGIKKLLISFLF